MTHSIPFIGILHGEEIYFALKHDVDKWILQNTLDTSYFAGSMTNVVYTTLKCIFPFLSMINDLAYC